MTYSMNRPGRILAATVALSFFLTSPAFAQNPPPKKANEDDPPPAVNPYPATGINPAARGAILNRVTPAPVVGAGNPTNMVPLTNGGSFSSVPAPASTTPPYDPNRAFNYSVVYPGWDPWGGTYFPGPYPFFRTDPFSGFMRGAADILSASGSFAVRVQESRMIGEQVRQARIDTRRKIFDQWLYERANTPTNQDERERIQQLELRRALTDPPPAEIMTAGPLNRLLKELQRKMGPNGARGQSIPIDDGTLRQINVRPPSTPGNVGVLRPLKDGVQMNWPPLLQEAAYQKEVNTINTKAATAVKEAIHKGAVDPSLLNEMRSAVNDLKKRLDDNVTDLPAADWIEAKRFLSQIEEARRALGHPTVANYFTDKFVAKGKTVPDLVTFLTSNGLEFAPAVAGDEASYMALYNYLVTYTNSLGSAPIQPRDE